GTILIPASTPLTETRPGYWLVERPSGFPPLPRPLRELSVRDAGEESPPDIPRLVVTEDGGDARFECDGALVALPAPLSADLEQAAVSGIPQSSRLGLVVEVEASPRWTVQDLVSICSGAQSGALSVDCRLGSASSP